MDRWCSWLDVQGEDGLFGGAGAGGGGLFSRLGRIHRDRLLEPADLDGAADRRGIAHGRLRTSDNRGGIGQLNRYRGSPPARKVKRRKIGGVITGREAPGV